MKHVGALAVLLVLVAAAASPCAQSPRDTAEVYRALSERSDDADRGLYLKANAGAMVQGQGVLDRMETRRHYDTSVPSNDPVVALIQIDPSKKVLCGLPSGILDSLGWLQPGSAVAFSGQLADALDWGETVTLYLGACSLSRR